LTIIINDFTRYINGLYGGCLHALYKINSLTPEEINELKDIYYFIDKTIRTKASVSTRIILFSKDTTNDEKILNEIIIKSKNILKQLEIMEDDVSFQYEKKELEKLMNLFQILIDYLFSLIKK
jgi:hypothetical protein